MPQSRRNAPLAVLIIGLLALLFQKRPWERSVPHSAPAQGTGRSSPAPAPVEEQPRSTTSTVDRATVSIDPVEAGEVKRLLDRIAAGGPFLHRKDGAVFRNAERRLPQQSSGYYHEFTVETPGSSDRGARRVIRGNGGELYYSNDHYRTFKRIDAGAE